MYVEGKSFEEMAQHFGVTIAAAQRQVYQYKRD
jgi:transposase